MTRPRWRLLSGALTLLMLGAWLLLLRPSSLGGPATYTVVSGRSMEPTYEDGDYVVTLAKETYGVGDVVAFRTGGGLVLHRIIGGSPEEGFVTRGDNNKGIDPWRPTDEEILGAASLRVPGLGEVVSQVQRPIAIGAIAGGMTTFMVVMRGKPKRRSSKPSPRTEAAALADVAGNRDLGDGLAGPSRGGVDRRWGLVALTIVLMVSLATITFQAFRLPITETEVVDGITYEQESAFAYTVAVERSTVYDGETIGPVTAEDPSAPPLFTRLVDSITVDLDYAVRADQSIDVEGSVAAVIRIRAGEDGWERTLPAVDPQPLEGGSVALTIPIDIDAIVTLIAEAEEETGHHPGTYLVTVAPVIDIHGSVGENEMADQYTPVFAMELSESRIVPISELTSSRSTTSSTSVVRPARIALPVGSVQVGNLRWMSSVALGLLLLGSALAVLSGRRWERLQIKARYGGMIVPVSRFDITDDRKHIRVRSIGDLARLARAGGGIILVHESPPGTFTYAVPADDAFYEYSSDLPRRP